METQYQVWLRARHPRTLEIVAEVRVLNLADRLLAERAVETAQSQCQPLVLEILRVHPGALVSVEMRMADRPSMHNIPRHRPPFEYQYGADYFLQHCSETNKQKALTDISGGENRGFGRLASKHQATPGRQCTNCNAYNHNPDDTRCLWCSNPLEVQS